MSVPYEISNKLTAVQVKNYIHQLGSIGYRNVNCSFGYDDASYEAIDEIYRMLQALESASENGARELWLCAKRGTIEDFADSYGDYEENLAEGIVKDYEDYEAYWKSEFPDELEWYCFHAVEDKDIKYRAIFLGHEHVIEVDGRREREYPNDISAFTAWLVDAVKLTIEAVRNGSYNATVAKLLPYKHRVGVIKLADLWKLYPNDKETFFENLTQEEVHEFLEVGSEDLSGEARLPVMTANDFYRFCAMGYAANHYEGTELPTKEQYYKHADGRDDGLGDIDPDSPDAFAQWLAHHPGGGHPWEVCRGGNSTHVSLYVGKGREAIDGYYLVVAGSAKWRCIEAIKFYLALKHAGLPVIIRDAQLLKNRLLGVEQVGIVPDGVFPRYCQSWFPGRTVEAFMNLSSENSEEEIALAQWDDIEPVKLKEGSNE